MLSPRPRAVITVVITEVLEATTTDCKCEREDSDEQAKPTKQAFCGFSGFGSGSSAASAQPDSAADCSEVEAALLTDE